MAGPFDISEIKTADQYLELLRKGNSQTLEIGLGELKIPCRLISAVEEAKLVVQAKQRALKDNPTGFKQEVFESYQQMKLILDAGTTINGAQGLPAGFLEALNGTELVALYDQYVSLNHTINPNIQELSMDEINQIIGDVKKKSLSAKSLYSWQLVGIGKYFLDVLIPSLPTDNEPGSAS